MTRYQTKCDTLTIKNEDLQKQLTQQVEDQEHIISLLKKRMQEQTEACLEMEEELNVEKHERQKDVDRLTKEVSAVKEEAQERIDEVVAENTVLHSSIDGLDEFTREKERYLQQYCHLGNDGCWTDAAIGTAGRGMVFIQLFSSSIVRGPPGRPAIYIADGAFLCNNNNCVCLL